MRRIAVFLVLLAGVIFFVDLSIAGVKTIREYAPREFAVKGRIETQANELVNEVKNNVARKPNMDLRIFVEGFADRTGFSAENDRIAKERAEGIAAILSREFPKAKINLVSRGDAINRRQVIVEWKYVPIPVTPVPVAPTSNVPQAEKSVEQHSDTVGISLVALILVFVMFALVFIYYRTKDKIPKKSKPRDRWLDIETDGRKHRVQITYGHGTIISPFKTRNGFNITKNENDLKGMIDSLKGCMKKDEFAPQRDELIQKKIIQKLN